MSHHLLLRHGDEINNVNATREELLSSPSTWTNAHPSPQHEPHLIPRLPPSPSVISFPPQFHRSTATPGYHPTPASILPLLGAGLAVLLHVNVLIGLERMYSLIRELDT